MQAWLESGEYIDSAHRVVEAFAGEHAQGDNDVARAVSLYYAVRDRIRYNPFLDFTVPSAFRASDCIAAGEGFCIGKASVLAAVAAACRRFSEDVCLDQSAGQFPAIERNGGPTRGAGGVGGRAIGGNPS